MKITNILLATLSVLFAVFALPSCNIVCQKGSGRQIVEKRNVGIFSKLDIAGDYKVIIKQDTSASVTITADDNLMKYIKTNLSGDKLTIHTSKNVCSSGQFILNISLRDLSVIKASGSIDVVSNGKLTTQDIELQLSGSTKVTLDLNAKNLTTRSSGSTELNLTGQATSHAIETSGSSQLNALNFVVSKYQISTSGSSECKINVLNDLSVNSSGSSDVQYRGNPSNINNNKSGSSSLNKIN